MIKRHLVALFHQNRCDRTVLIPMLEKLTPLERKALLHLLNAVSAEGETVGRRREQRQPRGRR
jgi:hypothetical protein